MTGPGQDDYYDDLEVKDMSLKSLKMELNYCIAIITDIKNSNDKKLMKDLLEDIHTVFEYDS